MDDSPGFRKLSNEGGGALGTGAAPVHLKAKKRMANWDILRTLAMFLVVVVHSARYLGPLAGEGAQNAVLEWALICDPIFFALSGYFAIRPLKTSLGAYYLKKVSGILIPCLVYSILLYLVSPVGPEGLSLAGLINFQFGQTNNWWFVSALLPYLMVAPFLYLFFESLDDHLLLVLARIVALLALWGCLSMFLGHVFKSYNMPLKATFLSVLVGIVPRELIPGSGYFVYFCLGYFARRLSKTLNDRHKFWIVMAGVVAWTLDTVLAVLGVEKADPSYYWTFATFAAFLITDAIRIKSSLAGKVFAWTAQRSFAIYLVQFTVIDLVGQSVYQDNGPLGNIGVLPLEGRVGAWVLTVVIAYLGSLALASMVDPTLVRGAQKLWGLLTTKVRRR